MTETSRIADQYQRAFNGDPWYGEPLTKILDGISASEAVAHPLPGARSIWEIVLHVSAWIGETTQRLRGRTPGEPAEGDWPAVKETTPEAWEQAKAALTRLHEELLRELASTPEDQLEEIVGAPARDRPQGTGISYYVLLHGVLQHNVYHTAQIAALRRVLAARWGI
jgi:uncharacterized damage-inducible protein DinB